MLASRSHMSSLFVDFESSKEILGSVDEDARYSRQVPSYIFIIEQIIFELSQNEYILQVKC